MDSKPLNFVLPPSSALQTKLDTETSVTGVTMNSKSVEKGNLFFAVKGTQVDGHRFVEQAVSQGASAVVVSDEKVFEKLDQAVLVADTAFEFGMAVHRFVDSPSEKLKLVGVTGTNGKTTVSFLLNELWEQMGVTSGLIGTVKTVLGPEKQFESELTTPDAGTLAKALNQMLANGCTHAAMEVSSIALDQWRVSGLQFDTAIFTNLSQDHLDYHGDLETYFASKKRLFLECPVWNHIVNLDNDSGELLRQAVQSRPGRLATFSQTNPEADYYASETAFSRFGLSARLKTPQGVFALKSPLMGKHNLENLLAVIAASGAQGFKVADVIEALPRCKGAPGRLERAAQAADRPAVFVDYAHTPDALKNVLEILSELRMSQGGRVIGVFGCGGDRDKAKRPLMAEIASSLCDLTIATSDNPRTEDPEAILDDVEVGILKTQTQYHRKCDRTEAIHFALSQARPEDWVLIAGKGHETYQILGTEKIDFDDRRVVEQYYST